MQNLNIKIYSDLDSIKEIADDWDNLADKWLNDLGFFNIISSSRDNVISPYVFCVYEGEKLISILPGRLEHSYLSCKFAYKELYRPKVKSIALIYNGHIGDKSVAVCEFLIQEILKALSKEKADIALLSHLDIKSNLYNASDSQIPRLLRSYKQKTELHWRFDLPPTIEEVLAMRNAKSRNRIKSYAKKLDKDYAGNVKTEIYTQSNDVDKILSDLETVAEKTYQRGLGAGFRYNEEWRKIMIYGFEKKYLRVYVLYVEDKPVAYGGGFLYGNTLFSSLKGYDPAFSRYRVGTNLMLSMFRDLCSLNVVKHVDYGFGDAEYKRSFSTECIDEQNIYIFSRSFRGFRINLLRTLILMSAEISDRLVERMGLKDKIKKIRRKAFTKQS
jgi:hypothetical protein